MLNMVNRQMKSWNIKVTGDKEEMISLGKQIAAENPEQYPPEWFDNLSEKYGEFFSSKTELYSNLYCALYCQALYGTNLNEYGYYRFENRSHEERMNYVTWYNRYAYMSFLNDVKDVHLLDNKFEAYTRLKPYYKRDAMLLAEESDYTAFCEFAAKHKSLFVKPVNLELAERVHRFVLDDGANLRKAFLSLLEEAKEIESRTIIRTIIRKLILEEEIVPSKAISQFNPSEMSVLRVPTILSHGEVHFFYPCFRIMCGDGKLKRGELYSINALIDAETGVVLTGGCMPGYIEETEYHPVTGVKIKGFVMPEWNELKSMLTKAALEFPSIRYIGWDVVHTEKGWCIIEGNPSGEFFFQLCVGHGVKDEFEKLIGFHLNMPIGLRWDVILQGH